MWHLLKQVFLSFFYGQSARTPPPSGNFTHSTKQERGETVVELELVYQFTITSESTLPEAVIQTCVWHLCDEGRFSYGEPPRTPPLEGTSLHR